MGWFSKKEKVVETPEEKNQKILDNKFLAIQSGNLFDCVNTFAIFNRKIGNIVNHEENVMFNTVEKAVEIKNLFKDSPDHDLVIVKLKKASFTVV